MRDPLGRLAIRHKLALIFAGGCLVAFAVGGKAVGEASQTALEAEIRRRVNVQSRACAGAMAEGFNSLGRRVEDFASDGFLRDRLERATAAATPADSRVAASAEITDHLRRNKLPLVVEFAGLELLDSGGSSLAGTGRIGAAEAAPPPTGAESRTTFGALTTTKDSASLVTSAVSTPVRSLDGSRVIGRLSAWIHPGKWIASVIRNAGLDDGEDPFDLEIVGPDGAALLIARSLTSPGSPAADSDLVGSGFGLAVGRPTRTDGPGSAVVSRPIAATGWSVRVAHDLQGPLASVVGLQSRFVAFGVLLSALAAGLLWYSLRFMAQPLSRLRDAAHRLQSGDLSARVAVETYDEIGALATSFNLMADAVAERTNSLRLAAADLQARQGELRREKERLGAVIASMRDGMVVLDGRGEAVVANVAAAPLLKAIKSGARLSAHHMCLDAGSSADCAACLGDASKMIRACILDVAEGVYEVHATDLPPDESGAHGRVLVARDVTVRVQEEERQIHQERLAVLGEVASVMAHELNNPLAAINMFNGMLQDELATDSPLREHTAVIQRNTESCKRAIRALLDYATDAAPEIAPLDVHAVLEDVVRFLRPMRERTRVALETDFSAEDCEVTGDEVQIRQIFTNLLVNAIQAMKGRGGTIRLATRNVGGFVETDVIDSGTGVSDAARAQIFRPFFTTKPRGEGTGLGLSTARRIAQLHGGSLDLIETSSQGSVFRVRLARRGVRP